MTTPLVERVTFEDLTTERETILSDIGMSEDELLRSGERWTLATEKQWRAFSRLENIRFLLGEDD